MTRVQFWIVICCVLILCMSVYTIARRVDTMQGTSCEELSEWKIQNVPARCLHHFMTTDGGQP